jgi:hypothetical protein
MACTGLYLSAQNHLTPSPPELEDFDVEVRVGAMEGVAKIAKECLLPLLVNHILVH